MATKRNADTKIKLERIDLRTTSTIKTTLVQAANLIGISMSTFVIDAAYEKAKNLIKEHEVITLSGSERDRFLLLLEAPPNPNNALKKAMREYLNKNKDKK